MVKLKLVDSKNIFGTMNTGTLRLSNITDYDKKVLCTMHNLSLSDLGDYTLTDEDKKAIFDIHRVGFGELNGFDWRKMFMASQYTQDGSYFEITRDYVEANPNGWTDINEDILIITDKVPGVVIGHPVADCPAIVMEDRSKGVTAMIHCTAKMVNDKMPMMAADALQKAYNSKDEDIIAYVSACAGDSWTYDSYPSWATDKKLWEKGIIEDENGLFHINLRKAIQKEMRERNIQNVIYNENDTVTNPEYYSNSAASPYGLNDQSKFGRNFCGAFYKVKK